MINIETRIRVQKLASARAGAKKELRGESFQETLARGPRWYPYLGTTAVQPSVGIDGFSKREDAVNDARRFREACIEFIDKMEGR